MPTDTDQDHSTHDWQEAGEAWGHAASDWACLYEHYAFEVITAIFERVGVGPTTAVIDIACEPAVVNVSLSPPDGPPAR